MAYKHYSKEEKMQYAKQFTSAQRKSYRAGERWGFLKGVHRPRKKEYSQRVYTAEQLDNLFDNLDEVLEEQRKIKGAR